MQRDKEAERKRCWGEGRSMIRDQEPGLTQGWEEPHFVVILLWLVLRAVVQEQAYILHARTALPLCWLIPLTYKTHKIEKNECKCQEICPCSQQPKKELVYDTYDRAVTHSFSDGMIPLGSLLLANIEHIFLQFIFPVWFIPHIHLEKHAQHHHNICTAKSITILIDHGFVSCSNTDNKELHTNSVPELYCLRKWQSKSIQDNETNPKESPQPQMPAWIRFEYTP